MLPAYPAKGALSNLLDQLQGVEVHLPQLQVSTQAGPAAHLAGAHRQPAAAC